MPAQADDVSNIFEGRPSAKPTPGPIVTPGSPTRSPAWPPAPAPTTQPVTLTYTPGDLSVEYEGLLLSGGLVATVVAESDSPVKYGDGEDSDDDFEQDPAGGATFATGDGGWIYVVDFDRGNDRGGVGALTFNAAGQVTDYRLVLDETNDNGNGRATPWGTYLTLENSDDDGSIYEVDPNGNTKASRTLLGSEVGRSAWTGVAIDNRRSNAPIFYVSSDQDGEGLVCRYKPSQAAINAHLFSDPAFHLLQDDEAPTVEYLVLVPTPDDPTRGVFTWIDDEDLGRDSASSHFAAISGLDAHGGVLYMTSEARQELFVLDLDSEEYTSESTDVGDFDGHPRSVVHILSGHEHGRRRRRQQRQRQRGRRQLHPGHGYVHGGGLSAGLPAGVPSLYFCEDGNDNESSGIYARTEEGRYVAILMDVDEQGDVTSLAFSPSLRQLFFALKNTGKVFMLERQDSRRFDEPPLVTSYIEE
jgi:hypothetical protein